MGGGIVIGKRSKRSVRFAAAARGRRRQPKAVVNNEPRPLRCLERIKQNPQAVMDASVIEAVCRELGLQWRETVLTPPIALAWFVRQVVEGNVSCAAVR
jgi:hypothetical protein